MIFGIQQWLIVVGIGIAAFSILMEQPNSGQIGLQAVAIFHKGLDFQWKFVMALCM